MANALVVDTSVAAKWLLRYESGRRSADFLLNQFNAGDLLLILRCLVPRSR